MKHWILLFCIFLLSACSQQDQASSSFKIVEIVGRDPTSSLIYRIKVPNGWIIESPSPHESIADTTKALVEFFIIDGDQKIRIAIHNFPSDKMNQRIPPMAQLSRWKKQFQFLEPTSLVITPQAFAGYAGFRLEAKGRMGNVKTAMLGWALQLAPEHYQSLSRPASSLIAQKYRQMRGDVTIKAVGDEILMDQHKEEIITFARSFQLIEDIP